MKVRMKLPNPYVALVLVVAATAAFIAHADTAGKWLWWSGTAMLVTEDLYRAALRRSPRFYSWIVWRRCGRHHGQPDTRILCPFCHYDGVLRDLGGHLHNDHPEEI